MPTVGTPGAKIFLKMNPPPTLSTIDSFFIRHFMSLLSEVVDNSLPVTKVIQYGFQVGIEDVEEFADVMLSCYGVYFSGIRKLMTTTPQRKTR